MMESILNKLTEIAHLPLNIKFDAERILLEIQSLELSPYNSWEDIKVGSNIESTWDSISLYSISGDTKSDAKEAWTGNFKETDAIKQCPYLQEVLLSLGAGQMLARVERINPNGFAGWHSHVLECKQPDWISVWQLPIQIPENSKFSVLHYMDYRCSDFKTPIPVYEESYKIGQVYCFNSHHYHNAFNYGDSPMIMVRFYVDTRNPQIKDILESSINRYGGEYMQTYEQYCNTPK
jgi:hypothetical protein